MDKAFVNRLESWLRRALAEIALPAEAQLQLFPIANTAITELSRRFVVAHAAADASRAGWIQESGRQALDELFHHLEMPFIYGVDPWDDFHSDECLRQSDFWAEARQRAQVALDLLS
jgi:hypothetical protein